MFPILLLAPLFFVFLRHRLSKSVHNLPPGPYPWPVIGNLPHIGTTAAHVATAKLAQIHGPLISMRLGSQLVIVASSPAAAKEILNTQDKILSGRSVPHVSYAKPSERNHVSIGWTYECTEQWRFLRTLCRNHIFASKVINDQARIREAKVHEMLKFLRSKEGTVVNIAQVVFACVFNTLGNLFFSKDFLSFDESTGEKQMIGIVRRIMELWSIPNISDLYPILGGLDLQGLHRKADECCEELCKTWESTIRKRREGTSDDVRKDKDFLDVLLDNRFSDDQINYLFLELVAAGTDTSTSTVEWAMAELLKNQETMKKVRDELDREIQTGVLIESQLSSLTYLDACVKETLRLHPPAPFLLPRRATEACKVMNYEIPKDTQVLVNVWAIGRDPNVWEDPLSFRAERFLNSNLDFKGNCFELLPFGGGRRLCAGLAMANRQVQLALASLIYHFEWFLPDGLLPHQLDMNEKFGVTMKKEKPLMVVLRSRN
uniref:Cytochrome P450 n=1 Tax=Polygala tenuifolia TaxID=355332 RepID=A0A455R8J6_9FABA|nr:cytochrome P450 [Polygala tenuifolia]